ncbi:helix-turn-helix domain-containing protein [Azospirillum doebereinerae]|uniref:DUF4115 domain-containing protein n=3 Tax=Azospirillum doebereinerae TaxID=92933 RepID=A0A3S0V3N6_9PROT|nr:helix-turn-helix domain-containing protein [Azospirillum doebereinerae]RUQ65911.1 DUF4115 domain-containing protein [Azospirillum doebereinerae]
MVKRKVFDDYEPVAAGPTVSETLRDTRIALGHELRDVASMLRIRYPYLQAIEDGRFSDLPGAAYAAGFLRSYAEYLGLDPDGIVARYKEEVAGGLRQQQLYLPTPATEERIPGGTLLLVTLVLAGIVYGGWYYLSATDRSVADLVPALPDRLVSLLDTVPRKNGAPPTAEPAPQQTAALPSSPVPAAPTAPSPAASPAPTPTPSAPAPAQTATPASPPAGVPAPAGTPLPPAKPPMAATLSTPAVPAPPASAMTNVAPPPAEDDDTEGSPQEPTPLSPAAVPAAPAPRPAEAAPANPNAKVYGLQYQNVRLVLKATQESWLQIRDGSEIIFTRVLKAGDTYRVPDKAGVKIRTGNAGGLVVVADGADSAPLGTVGQVLRDVPIDAHGVVRPAAR